MDVPRTLYLIYTERARAKCSFYIHPADETMMHVVARAWYASAKWKFVDVYVADDKFYFTVLYEIK